MVGEMFDQSKRQASSNAVRISALKAGMRSGSSNNRPLTYGNRARSSSSVACQPRFVQNQEGGPTGGRSYTASSCSYSASGSSGAMPGPHDPNQSGNPHQEEIRDQAIEQDPRRAE